MKCSGLFLGIQLRHRLAFGGLIQRIDQFRAASEVVAQHRAEQIQRLNGAVVDDTIFDRRAVAGAADHAAFAQDFEMPRDGRLTDLQRRR